MRPASFIGRVIHGDEIGKSLGFPTANLDTSRELIQLGEGIYAAYATVQGQKYRAAISIMGKPWKVEVYLFDFDGHDMYGEELAVEVLDFISPMQRFSSEDMLKEKIQADIGKILFYFENKNSS